jgi:hypothetical protein
MARVPIAEPLVGHVIDSAFEKMHRAVAEDELASAEMRRFETLFASPLPAPVVIDIRVVRIETWFARTTRIVNGRRSGNP